MYMYHGTWKIIPIKKEFLIGSKNSYKKDLTKSSYMESSFCNQGTNNLTLNQKLAQANVTINQPIEKITLWDFHSELMKYVVWMTKLKTKWVKTLYKQNHRFFILITKRHRKLDFNTICKLAHIELSQINIAQPKITQTVCHEKTKLIFETRAVWKHHQGWGWICHAELPFGFKHPIILRGKHMIFK